MDETTYSWQLQLVGAAVVLVASVLGVAAAFLLARLWTPTLSKRRRRFLAGFTLALKGLGSGVVISTALIHLINEAYDYFEDSNWSSDYDAFPMVLAMVGLLGMALTDFAFSNHHNHNDSKTAAACPAVDVEKSDVPHLKHEIVSSSPSTSLHQRRLTAVFVEITLVIHSVLIGFDLGLQNKSGWNTLVFAVSFHQFFEGLALGQLIAEAEYDSRCKSVLVALSFSLSTAFGIVIGILVRVLSSDSDDEMTPSTSALIGVLNSLCGGILLYTGVVHLLLPWFVQNPTLRSQSPRIYAAIAFVSVALGMAIMAIIGIWA